MITAQQIWDDLCESENGNPHWKQIRFEEVETLVDRIAKLEEFARWVGSAPVSSGVCCCGSDMESHTLYDGHGPVDQWDYSLDQWLRELAIDRTGS